MSLTARENNAKTDIMSLLPEQLEQLVLAMGQPRFRAGQIFGWLHQRQAAGFDEMSDLPAALRRELDRSCFIAMPRELLRQQSKNGDTIKLLLELYDGNSIESVLMRHDYGNSLCISSQAGCRMGCKFCASTIGGKVRDLLPSEMLGQVYAASKLTGLRVDSIVIMGIGEPLDNYQNLLRFLEIIRHPKGRNLSHRHISVSTCGLAPKIDELAAEKLQLTLSVSLHASDNATRDSIMPVNRSYPIERLMQSCKNYFAATGRRISYEYSLISGVNDSPGQAKSLLELLKGQSCHVNLIPVNPVAGTGFKRGSRGEAERFCGILNTGGISATIRREFGAEIDAACGQLRRKNTREGQSL